MRAGGLIIAGTLVGWCAVSAVAAGKAPAPKKAVPPAAAKPPVVKPAADPHISPEAAEFFEKEVRPVLAEQCYTCHGPKLQQSGLRVDNLAGLLKGMDGGRTALVKGDPDKSPLIQVLSHAGKIKMPPAKKLPQHQIDALTQWVKMGAPWPGSPAQSATGSQKSASQHWSFQPVKNPPVPVVKNRKWVKSPIDAFILQKLEAKKLAPNVTTDRRSLIRRAYFDLHGLPPTEEEVQAFIKDPAPDAFAKVVDRLLASPRYGERWGRYWLDVARYADTKGYVFQEERRYPFAYTYRDWVIKALNEDMPYDQFLVYQIAADQAVQGQDKSNLAAMGFLTLGRRFLNQQPDIIDDRMDTVFRGTQALTVACARCHDHKFDPIPTADYYSLYGVFASSQEPGDLPVIGMPEQNAAYAEYEKQLGALKADADRFLNEKRGAVRTRVRGQIAAAMLAAREAAAGDANQVATKRDLSPMLLRRWVTFLADTRKNHHAILAPWHALAAIPDAEFAAKAPELMTKFAANGDSQRLLHAAVAKLFAEPAPRSLEEVAQRYQALLAEPPASDQQLHHALDSIGGPLNLDENFERLLNRDERNQLQALRQKVDRFTATSPAAPPRAMVLTDRERPVPARIFRRGNANNPGDEVPRQFLAVLTGPERKPFTQGSGRLEMAQAIASKENPLTARVMVNRVWIGHFGSGLVRTPSDFGLRSEPPTHPELLDYLSTRFMQEGWSLKKLHRLIMLSSTYQQRTDHNAVAAKADPENLLLWRQSRRRLDLESMRDTLLAASGALDLKMGGPSVDILAQPFQPRRSVYGFIERQNLPNFFRTFDFASPDTSSPQRFQTSVPQQALYLMNSPFVAEQARKLVARPDIAALSQPAERVRAMYRVLYQRAPEPDELAAALHYLEEAKPGQNRTVEAPLWQYGYGEVDPTGRLKGFQPLPQFKEGRWQGGPETPDPKLGWVLLTAQGGHAGNDQRHAAVRRWVAPRDGAITIQGELGHGAKEGDGIRARVITSRGVAGTWTAHNGKAATPVARLEVKRGDTVDFVVDCRDSVTNDSFTWAPVIRMLEAGATGQEWSASAGFSGPQAPTQRLSAWEKYAQVLLMSNELLFVD